MIVSKAKTKEMKNFLKVLKEMTTQKIRSMDKEDRLEIYNKLSIPKEFKTIVKYYTRSKSAVDEWRTDERVKKIASRHKDKLEVLAESLGLSHDEVKLIYSKSWVPSALKKGVEKYIPPVKRPKTKR